MKYLFRSNGIYFGFIHEGNIFSRDGVYLGWLEGNYVWDMSGNFRGELMQDKYILKNLLSIPATARPPKLSTPATPQLPNPVSNITPISLSLGYIDGFR